MADSAQSARTQKSSYPILVLLILSSILLQKIALPGTSNALPVSTVIMPALILLAWINGIIIIRPNSFLILSAFLLCGVISFIINAATNQVSFASLFLIAFVQFPLMFGLATKSKDAQRAVEFFTNFMFVLSVLGAAQFLSQSVIGLDVAFYIDRQLPTDMIVNTYHNLNPISYGSNIFKSNGIFFAEPAFFSQFIAIATIIELVNKQRLIRLCGYAAGLLCCYSGTGLIILGIFGGVYAVRSGRSVIVVAGLLGAAIVVAFGDILQLELITNRIDEFSTPNTSGHARFISVFVLIRDYGLSDMTSILFGKGPGTIRDYFPLMPFETFDPTWGKLLFEYGGIAFLVYMLFIISIIDSKKSPIVFPLLLMYFFGGGYLVDTSIISLILVFLSLGIDHHNSDIIKL